MESRSLIIISGQILLAITILASTLIVTNTLKQIKFGRGSVSVKGCAEKEIQSDFAKMEGGYSATAPDLQEAYQKLEKDLEILQGYLNEQGVAIEEVVFSPIYTSTINQLNEKGRATNVIEAYTLRQDFSISSTNVALIAKISQTITGLIKEGLTITSTSPSYYYLNIDQLKIAMLAQAAEDAHLRAGSLISKGGSSVGDLISAHQGVFQITPAYSNSVSDYGEFDTSSIAKRIKAVVTMEYEIN